MSTQETGGPAFPRAFVDGHDLGSAGMTLRDYLAAMAMPSHIAGLGRVDLPPVEWHAEIAKQSFATADAMLKARAA